MVPPEAIFDIDVWTLARTIYGEARGEPREGRIAVAWVILNRTRKRRRGRTIVEVCHAPAQFSCWNRSALGRAKIESLTLDNDPERPALLHCLEATLAVLCGREGDPTGGATHYHAHDVRPSWARGREPSARIGRHSFYSDIP